MQYGLCSRFMFATTDGNGSGTASQWMAIDQGLIWSFTRTFAPTRMVCHYECSWQSFNEHFEVPVIAVFTKHDQFLRNVEMDVSDYPAKYSNKSVSEVAEQVFQEHYLSPLGVDVGYVRLESELQVICQGHMLMLFERNACERWPMWSTCWEDSCSTEWGCCYIHAFNCAEGQCRIEC